MAALVPPNNPPPPPVFQWTINGALQLIIERRNLHWQFDRLANRNHNNIWNLISNRVFAATGFMATANQCCTKWNSLKRGYENVRRILSGNEDGFPITSPNTFDQTCFEEMNDEFWLQTGNYLIFISNLLYLSNLFTILHYLLDFRFIYTSI
jgi:hypothetical protein